MPKLRQQKFETAIIERYKRREYSDEEALIEMYLAGVSVRLVEGQTIFKYGSFKGIGIRKENGCGFQLWDNLESIIAFGGKKDDIHRVLKRLLLGCFPLETQTC